MEEVSLSIDSKQCYVAEIESKELSNSRNGNACQDKLLAPGAHSWPSDGIQSHVHAYRTFRGMASALIYEKQESS